MKKLFNYISEKLIINKNTSVRFHDINEISYKEFEEIYYAFNPPVWSLMDVKKSLTHKKDNVLYWVCFANLTDATPRLNRQFFKDTAKYVSPINFDKDKILKNIQKEIPNANKVFFSEIKDTENYNKLLLLITVQLESNDEKTQAIVFVIGFDKDDIKKVRNIFTLDHWDEYSLNIECFK